MMAKTTGALTVLQAVVSGGATGTGRRGVGHTVHDALLAERCGVSLPVKVNMVDLVDRTDCVVPTVARFPS